MKKKVIVMAILAAALLTSSCADWTPEQQAAFNQLMQDFKTTAKQCSNSRNQSSYMMMNQAHQLQHYNMMQQQQWNNSNPFNNRTNCRVVPMGYTTTIQCD